MGKNYIGRQGLAVAPVVEEEDEYAVMAYVVMAYVVMANIVMAYVVMTYIVMAYIVMVYIVMAYIVMAYIVMAYIVMARSGSQVCRTFESFGELRTKRRRHARLSQQS